MSARKSEDVAFGGGSVLPYYTTYLVPAVLAAEYAFRLPFLTLIFTFGIVPIFDILIGNDESNPTADDEKELLADNFRFKLVLWLWVPVQLLAQFLLAWATVVQVRNPVPRWASPSLCGLTLSRPSRLPFSRTSRE